MKLAMKRKTLCLIALLVLLLIKTDVPQSPPVILLLGDSVTLGGYTENNFARILQERLGNRATIINAGISGAKAPDALANWDEYATMEPNLVIIYFGTNDVKHIHHNAESWDEYRSALLKLAALAPYAILVTPHRGIENPERAYFLQDVERAASLIRSLDYPVADVYALCCDESQLLDYAHPNDEGHQIIADTIYPLLRGLYLE